MKELLHILLALLGMKISTVAEMMIETTDTEIANVIDHLNAIGIETETGTAEIVGIAETVGTGIGIVIETGIVIGIGIGIETTKMTEGRALGTSRKEILVEDDKLS